MSRQWGIREPNTEGKVCQCCGKMFYTTKVEQQIYCSVKCRETNEYQNERTQKAYREYKRYKMRPRESDRGTFRWDPYSDENYDKNGDYYRQGDLGYGVDDGTEEVMRMLRRGIVWARFAELSAPTIPYQEAIWRLERAVSYEREKQQEKKLRREKAAELRRMSGWN